MAGSTPQLIEWVELPSSLHLPHVSLDEKTENWQDYMKDAFSRTQSSLVQTGTNASPSFSVTKPQPESSWQLPNPAASLIPPFQLKQSFSHNTLKTQPS